MAFIEQRLLDCIAFGSGAGPTWKTRRIGLRSGIIMRNAQQSMPLYRFNLLYRNLKPYQHEAVIDVFNACMAGVHSFRVKDWQDYEAEDEALPVLGTAAPQSVQLVKVYSFGGQSVTRNIRKPVSGTVTMTHNGAALTASVDYTTGIATFTTTAGHVLRWSGEFDVPVMFDVDELPFSGDNRSDDGLFLTGDVPLLEDRLA
jgi:uncharacterized protein (TIGR02217 family)